MTYVDALARVDQIQATLTELAARFSATSSSTANAAAFTTALNSVTATTDATAAPGTASGVSGTDIVDAAKKYVGVPYVFGGEDQSGMDCSGLVQRVLKDLGIDAPRVVSQQQNIGTEVKSLADAQPGDLIVTNNADHIVIYAGDGMIIHAPYAGRTVSYQKNYLTDADIQTIRRVVPESSSSTASVTVASTQSAQMTALLASISGSGGTSSTGSSSTGAKTPTVTDLIAAAQLSLITGKKS